MWVNIDGLDVAVIGIPKIWNTAVSVVESASLVCSGPEHNVVVIIVGSAEENGAGAIGPAVVGEIGSAIGEEAAITRIIGALTQRYTPTQDYLSR
jgi:hypothetical protein